MSLSRWFPLAGLASLLLLGQCLAVRATMLPLQQPVALRLATTDSVVIGKVTGFEQKTISAGRFAGDKGKSEYTIAIVKIEEAFGNVANIKRIENVRVGFLPQPAILPPILPPNRLPLNPKPAIVPPARPGQAVPIQPQAGPQPLIRSTIVRRPFGAQLVKDQEVCLYLTPHHEANFYTYPNFGGVIVKDKNNPQAFTTEVHEVRRCFKLLANPKASLASKNAEDRLATAAMLLTRYRTPVSPNTNPPQQEPIDAAESKAILLALAEADWTPRQLSPQGLFYRLNLTAKDGWTQPKNFQEFPEAARKWLKENAEKYRIQRFVAGQKSEK